MIIKLSKEEREACQKSLFWMKFMVANIYKSIDSGNMTTEEYNNFQDKMKDYLKEIQDVVEGK